MNKQEVIEKIKSEKKLGGINSYGLGYNEALDKAVYIVKQLDESEKPVVPQFIDTWIQGAKYNGFDLYEAMTDDEMPDKVATWIVCNSETFAKAWLFGYEVEKEKLYTVEIPNPNTPDYFVLRKNCEDKVDIAFYYVDWWRDYENTWLTEAEIKKDFDWAWQFAKDVEK